MFKVQTLNSIAKVGLNQFPSESYQIGNDLAQPDAILVRSQNMHDLTLASSVKVIGRAGAGVNNIPVSSLTKVGIPVLNTPGANANAVRELVLAGMLLASRNICQAWDYVNRLEAKAEAINQQIEKDKKQFVGFELMGKTLGVVGLGSIGVKVANAALSLGMRVIGYDPTITVHRAWELSSEVRQAHNIEALLTDSDFITIHVPLTDETKNLINYSRLNLMKTGAILLNFSREGIIDNDALAENIRHHKIRSYVTDFPSPVFKGNPSVISLPHLGASTYEAEENCAIMIVKQVRDFLELGHITNSVNFPAIQMPSTLGCNRLAIVNANIPNMVAQISSKLAAQKLNIVSLMNQSRDSIAYTLIDVNDVITDNVIKEIINISGVIQVRKIQ
jgi:D-3-phosphoglycerate dehydrogenase / 2-oxoglutarate reductase